MKGELTGADNGSHAILGVTQGLGHSVADDTPAGPNTVAATWGRHGGSGAGVGGINTATNVPLAGTARGVEGIVAAGANGSHAVYGITNGAGHAIAGEVPEDALGPDGDGLNTVAATWGRQFGTGAGIGGISIGGYGGEFVGGRAHVRLIQEQVATNFGPPTGDGHLPTWSARSPEPPRELSQDGHDQPAAARPARIAPIDLPVGRETR